MKKGKELGAELQLKIGEAVAKHLNEVKTGAEIDPSKIGEAALGVLTEAGVIIEDLE